MIRLRLGNLSRKLSSLVILPHIKSGDHQTERSRQESKLATYRDMENTQNSNREIRSWESLCLTRRLLVAIVLRSAQKWRRWKIGVIGQEGFDLYPFTIKKNSRKVSSWTLQSSNNHKSSSFWSPLSYQSCIARLLRNRFQVRYFFLYPSLPFLSLYLLLHPWLRYVT